MSFAENLKDAMECRGFTCKRLAEAASVPVGTVYHWRAGHQVPHVDVVRVVADAMGVSCDWLIRGRR